MVLLFLSSIIPIIAGTAVLKEGVKAIDKSTQRALNGSPRQPPSIRGIGRINTGIRPSGVKPININVQGILKDFKTRKGLAF